MAGLFDKSTDNVLDILQSEDLLDDHFAGDLFNGASSNFLGIAIGKKAKARKKAKRDDRQAAKKYKLETDRIRALQGQPKENIVKDIASGLTNVASSIFGGGQQQQAQPEQDYSDQAYQQQMAQLQAMQQRQEPPAKNNTIIYIIIGLAVVGAAVYFLKK